MEDAQQSHRYVTEMRNFNANAANTALPQSVLVADSD